LGRRNNHGTQSFSQQNSAIATFPPFLRTAGLVVDACLTDANGHAERIAALHMIEPRADRPRPITLGTDKAYDAEDFANELRSMNATPHVAQTARRRSTAAPRGTRATL
jgi:hypothetical protein